VGGASSAVPATAQAALDSGNPAAVLSVLFPADQNAATQRYLTAILTPSSPAVQAQQQTAMDRWFAGDDVSGHNVGEIRAPTLIADGTEDALNPTSNDRIRENHPRQVRRLVLAATQAGTGGRSGPPWTNRGHQSGRVRAW
jgi:hypothetical protein